MRTSVFLPQVILYINGNVLLHRKATHKNERLSLVMYIYHTSAAMCCVGDVCRDMSLLCIGAHAVSANIGMTEYDNECMKDNKDMHKRHRTQ